MAEVIISLQIDPKTGKKNVVIEHESDMDALPHEHEEDHRRIVDDLIEGGTLKAKELGKVIVRRDGSREFVEDLGEGPEEQEAIKKPLAQ